MMQAVLAPTAAIYFRSALEMNSGGAGTLFDVCTEACERILGELMRYDVPFSESVSTMRSDQPR